MLMWQSGRILRLQFLLLSPIKLLTDPFITHLSDKERNPGRQISAPLGVLGRDGWCCLSMINRKHNQNINKICQTSIKKSPSTFLQVFMLVLCYGNSKRAVKPWRVTPPFLEGDNGNKQQTQGCWWLVLSQPRGGDALPAWGDMQTFLCRDVCDLTTKNVPGFACL